MILTFVKSSNLEIREVDLFLAVARWHEHQEDVLSADDKKQIFWLIRYTFMTLTDLLRKVKPSQLVDENLYTAALEYTFMDTTKTHKSDFPHDQLSVWNYFLNFSFPSGLLIEHTRRGTVITATQTSRLCSLV